MLLPLLALLATAAITPTSDNDSDCFDDTRFFDELLAAGFVEIENTTIALFVAGKIQHLYLQVEEGASVIMLHFERLTTGKFVCGIVVAYIPSPTQEGTITACDAGADRKGHDSCEVACYSSIEVFQNMFSGSTKLISI